MKFLSVLGSALIGAASLAACAPTSDAQAPNVRVEASGRATSQVALSARPAPGEAQAVPMLITVDYGQPHARGRVVVGTLIPYDEVWRTGANQATVLRTDVDLELGDARIPRGSYTLYSLLTRSGWQLIINRQTGQWGTQYDAAQDLARVTLRTVEGESAAESFSITLVPAAEAPAQGSLAMSWGTLRGSVPWRVAP